MTKPIERVYVTENNLDGPIQASGFDVNPERAERFREAIKGVTRVFVEEKPWISARPPDNGRVVLVSYAASRGDDPRTIVACFGSEGKWVAEDHNLRRTYLDPGTVLAWREMPDDPQHVAMRTPVGWR